MKIVHCIIVSFLVSQAVFSQTDSTIDKLISFPGRFIAKFNKKVSHTDKLINTSVDEYLNKFEKTERKLKSKLYKGDSSSKYFFAKNLRSQYQEYLEQKEKDSIGKYSKNETSNYLPNLDSVKVALQYIAGDSLLKNVSTVSVSSLKLTIGRVAKLETNLDEAAQLKEFVAKRKEQLKEYIIQHTSLPPSITGLYSQYSSQYYYYSQQIQEYKDILNNPDKMLKSSLEYLNKLPSFRSFMANNSVLSSLFPSSPNAGSLIATNGLQSRSDLQNLLRGAVPSTPDAMSAFACSRSMIQTQLSKVIHIRNRRELI